MNQFLHKSKTLFVVFLLIIVYSCNNDSKKANDEMNTDSTAINNNVKYLERNMTYKLPSPVELYIILKTAKAPFNKEILNPTNKVSKYYTRESKAINFGIYASDLAYCSTFGKNQETFQYFKVAKQLADEIGLTKGFDENVAKRIDANINNSDSLYQLTSDSYFIATKQLDQDDQTNVLPYILTGGWLESVYVATNSVKKFSADNEIVNRIVDQQFLLENLLDYINSLENPEQYKNITDKLIQLQDIYITLLDNQDVIITEKQFNKLSKMVMVFRNQLTS